MIRNFLLFILWYIYKLEFQNPEGSDAIAQVSKVYPEHLIPNTFERVSGATCMVLQYKHFVFGKMHWNKIKDNNLIYTFA